MGHVLLVCSCLEPRDAVCPTASAPLTRTSYAYALCWFNKGSPSPCLLAEDIPKEAKEAVFLAVPANLQKSQNKNPSKIACTPLQTILQTTGLIVNAVQGLLWLQTWQGKGKCMGEIATLKFCLLSENIPKQLFILGVRVWNAGVQSLIFFFFFLIYCAPSVCLQYF